jgi:Domain of unknown function (DUF4253)
VVGFEVDGRCLLAAVDRGDTTSIAGAVNYDLDGAHHVAVLRGWQERFGAELVTLTRDHIELLVGRPAGRCAGVRPGGRVAAAPEPGAGLPARLGSVYAALARGRIDSERLRELLCASCLRPTRRSSRWT